MWLFKQDLIAIVLDYILDTCTHSFTLFLVPLTQEISIGTFLITESHINFHLIRWKLNLKVAFADNVGIAEVNNTSEGRVCLLSVQCSFDFISLGESAGSGLLESSKLGARSKDEAVRSNGSVSPELLYRALLAIDRDIDIGVRARVIVGELDGGNASPGRFEGGGQANGGEEGTSESGGVCELHFGWFDMVDDSRLVDCRRIL